MMSAGADPGLLANSVDHQALQQLGEEWYLEAERYRSGLRRLWDREKYKREREGGTFWTNPSMQTEIDDVAAELVEHMRKSMLAQRYHDLQYYPPCWGHDAYDRPSGHGQPGEDTDSGSESSSSMSQQGDAHTEKFTQAQSSSSSSAPRQTAAPRHRSRTPGRRTCRSQHWPQKSEGDGEGQEQQQQDDLALVQKKWLIKARRPKVPYQTSKMIWRSAKPEHRTSSTRVLDPRAPRALLSRRCTDAPWHRPAGTEDDEEDVVVEIDEDQSDRDEAAGAEGARGEGAEADTAEGLWLILLGLDPHGGFNAPADLGTMPMTLPVEVVENVRVTLAEYTSEEVEELREALPAVLASIREELTGLLDESAQSRSSSSRPAPPATEEPGAAREGEHEAEDSGDAMHLMQRTVTGMLRTSKAGQGIREDKLALHQELQNYYPAGTASHLARRLRRRLQAETHRVDDWATLDAVLAANSETLATCPKGEEMASHEEWVNTWYQRLIKRTRGDQATSSDDPCPAHVLRDDETQLYEDREREEEAQAKEDQELYEWHQRRLASEAKKEDEIALQAHLGVSTRRPPKKIRLTVEVLKKEGKPYYSEYEIHEGEEIKLGISTTTGAAGYYMDGKPVSTIDAHEHLRKEEDRLRNGPGPPERTTFNMDDPATKAMFDRWVTGRASAAEVADLGGHAMVEFFEVIREIDAMNTLPATLPQPPETAAAGDDSQRQNLATTIRYNFLGERWKTTLCNPEFRGSYTAWLSGNMGDDLVCLRYGDGAMALFRYLLEKGHKGMPHPSECGEDSSDSETVPFEPAPAMAAASMAPDDAETLVLGGCSHGEEPDGSADAMTLELGVGAPKDGDV